MADYSRYGGELPDWTAYIAANPGPVLPPGLTREQIRDRVNLGREANSREILKTITANIKTEDFSCTTTDGQEVPIRVYKDSSTASGAKLPVFIWFHGGGFCYGTLSSEDGYCSWIAEKAGIIVVNVCYRHTPEWKWPAQREDAFNALNWVFENIDKIGGDREKVLVGGRSSGSNLSAGIALRDKETQGKSRIKGLVLDLPHVCHADVFPIELMAPGKGSFEQNVAAPILPASAIKVFNNLLDVKDPRDRYYSVLLAPDADLAGFPSTHFLVAGRDPLRDEALLFEEKLKRIGVKTGVDVYTGIPHGFRRYEELEASRQFDKDVLKAFKWLLQ